MIEITDIIGTSAFAISALFVYQKYKLDMLGLLIIAILTALGGGVIRALILNETPTIMIDNTPILIVISSLIIGALFKINENFEDKYLFLIFDAIGLVSFSITGALIGIEQDFGYFGVIFLALISATCGGVLRDLLLNRVPILITADFYGMISIIIGTIIYLVDINVIHLFIIGLAIRAMAIKYKWSVGFK